MHWPEGTREKQLVHSQTQTTHSVFQLTRRRLCHVCFEGMQMAQVVFLCVLSQILQPAKVLRAVGALTSGRKSWIFAAILLMCHPVFLLCKFAPTGKLAGDIIELWIMQFLVLG